MANLKLKIMDNFFSNFANTNAEVKSSNANIVANVEFYGLMDVTKGMLKMTIHFFIKLHKMKYENCVAIDDWEITDKDFISFNGIPIDNMSKLIATLQNSGLNSLAEGLTIDDKDFERVLAKHIEQTEEFKNVFGKDSIIFAMLSDEEQYKIKLKYVIDNYEDMTTENYIVKELSIVSESSTEMPTLNELKELYKK